MIRTAAIAALLLTGCATAPVASDESADTCHVTVSFGSYAMGVDAELKARILALVSADPDIEAAEETRWGREGESDLCIRTSDRGAADRLFDLIAEMIPEHSDRAPTSVTHIDGRTDAAGPPPEWN